MVAWLVSIRLEIDHSADVVVANDAYTLINTSGWLLPGGSKNQRSGREAARGLNLFRQQFLNIFLRSP